MTGAAGTWQSLRSPDTSQPFQRLVPFSWHGELLVICGGMLLSFLVAGFWYPYWRIADMDFWVVQVAALMLTDWAIDTLGMGRGLKQEYFIITDPLAIIAAALLIAKLTDLQRHRWTYSIGVALIIAHIVVSQAEPVKHVFKSEGPEVWCGLYGYAPRVERYPFCPPEPKPSR